MMQHTLATDGASRGNPGPGAIAAAVFDESGVELASDGRSIGNTTNNQAEYRALILGLQLSANYTSGILECVSDSELLVKQLNGEYRVRDPALRGLHRDVRRAAAGFEVVTYEHVRGDDPRIQRVDAIANISLHQRRAP